MKCVFAVCTAVVFFLCFGLWSRCEAEQILWDVIGAGGVMGSSSSGYALSATVGQVGIDQLADGSYGIYSGFWNPWMVDQLGARLLDISGLPSTYQLCQNYPNPFARKATIKYAVPTASLVRVEVFDLQGHRVCVLSNEAHLPGYYVVNWNGKSSSDQAVSSGLYLCRMRARGSQNTIFERSIQMLLLK